MSGKSKKAFPFWATKLLSVVGMFLVLGGAYLFTNHIHPGDPGTRLPIFIDSIIPFNRHWVWFYYLYFVAIVFPIFLIKNKPELWRGLTAYAITAIVTLAFFTLWKTEMIRPDVLGDDLSAKLLRTIYRHDKPYNCFPSQHVAFVWTAALISARLNRWAGAIVVILALLISISTLFIKQHWFVDVPGGIVVAALAYFVAYYCFFKKHTDALEKDGE